MIPMYTAEEAETKWCPLTFNNGNAVQNGHCLGPVCMAWRWNSRIKETGYCGMAKE
jgi:hypothetical protein